MSGLNWTEDDFAEYNRKHGRPELGIILTKPSKYHNNRVKVDGILFDSQKEADYYNDLKMRLKAGVIRGYCRQAEFILTPGFGDVRPMSYRADFIVFNLDGTAEIIDTKGFLTEEFRDKHKVFMEKYPKLELKLE